MITFRQATTMLTPTATTPFARFTGGVWTLQAAQQPLKWRGYCSQLDDVGVASVGSGCQASTGRVPASFTNFARVEMCVACSI